MSVAERIVYSGNELIQILEEFLDRMKTFSFDSRYSLLLGEHIIDKVNQWDKTIRRQKDLPLTLTVCGEFKRGKSSLINALLGEDVVTTNITTETITTNKISYGVHKNELVLSGGRRILLKDEELKCDKLKLILADLPEKSYEIEMKRPIDVLKKLTIIDTPGLGDSMTDFLPDVKKALQQSDAVVYVFSALYPLSMQEQLFIKNVIKPQKYTDLIMISNYVDSFEEEEDCDRVHEVIRDRISEILPEEKIYMLSALDERCRQLGAKRPNEDLKEYLENNFSEFRVRLVELLEEKKEYVIPNRVHRLISGMTDELKMLLDVLVQGLTLSNDEINQKSEELSKYKEEQDKYQENEIYRIDEMIEAAEGKTIQWIAFLLDEMEKEIDTLNKYSIEEVKNNYSMYCTETIQNAVDRCMDKFTAELYRLLDDISENVGRKFTTVGITATPSFKFALQNKSWTKGDNVAFVSNLALANTWLGFATDYVAGSMRKKEINQSMPDVIQEIKMQFPGLRAATFAAIKDVYKSIRNNVKSLIKDHFDEQILTLEAQLEQAAMIARQNDKKKEEIKAAVFEMNKVLDDIRNEMSISIE